MEIFLHAGNVLYVVSYSVRDILTLRIVTVVAILSLVGYYITSDLKTALAWSALFLGVNLFQTWRLLVARRPVRLDMDERRLHRLAFPGVDERHFKRFVEAGAWESLAAGARFIEQGERVPHLRVILDGSAAIEVDGAVRGRVGPGQFVGEGAFLSGEMANASVVANGAMRVLSVPCAGLKAVLQRHPELRTALQRIIAGDLLGKLRGGTSDAPLVDSAEAPSGSAAPHPAPA